MKLKNDDVKNWLTNPDPLAVVTHLSFTFTSIRPLVPPRMDPNSVTQLVAKLPSFSELQSLRITLARLNADQAMRLIHALPSSVKKLDLDHNIIGNYDGQNFIGFCKAIVDSNISRFTFGTTNFNEEEAKILAEHLSTIQRPFEFIFHVGPHVTPVMFQHYMNAMHHNPFLSISLSGKLQYASRYNAKEPPSLFQLSLSKWLSCSSAQLPETPPEVTREILEIQPQMRTYHQNFDMKRMLQRYIILQAQLGPISQSSLTNSMRLKPLTRKH